MADYTITTTPDQDAGLTWYYDNYVNHETWPTKEEFFQNVVEQRILNSFVVVFQRDHTVALEASVKTIPEANQAAAIEEIGNVIVANGGTIVTPGPPPPVIPTSDNPPVLI